MMNTMGHLQVIPFEDIRQDEGLLRRRARYTFDLYSAYSPQHVLTLNYGTTSSKSKFPGDTIGRYILSTTLLARALHEPAPDTLENVMNALPSMLNEEGYLGWVLPKDRADETGLANIGWANGLTEYYNWTRDPVALRMCRNVFERIILPVKDAYYYYYSPEKSDGKIKWVNCTSDTAQGFGIIDPATRGYALFPSQELREEINELIRLYMKLDHVGIQAQIHALLTTTRGILRWYETEGNPEHLAFAENLYRNYRSLAMTENYENYNWFGKPVWTEGCAIVDSLTVTLKLWQLTGKTEYLEDAHLILFNALLANQKNGDFGTNNCAGANNDVFVRDGLAGATIAPWCCSVWGGKGFARTMQYSQFMKNDGLVVTIMGNNTVTARLPDGLLTLKQTTGYPHDGGVRFEVVASESANERELLVFMPSWIISDSVSLVVNGKKMKPVVKDSFLSVKRVMKRGDAIEIAFAQSFRSAAPLSAQHTPGCHRYLYGPLVLGVDTLEAKPLPLNTEFTAMDAGCYKARTNDMTLVPLCDLRDLRHKTRRSRTGNAQILFADSGATARQSLGAAELRKGDLPEYSGIAEGNKQ